MRRFKANIGRNLIGQTASNQRDFRAIICRGQAIQQAAKCLLYCPIAAFQKQVVLRG